MSDDIQAKLEQIAARLNTLANQVDSVANDLLDIKAISQQQAEQLRQQEKSADKSKSVEGDTSKQ